MRYQIITKKINKEGLEVWFGMVVDLTIRQPAFEATAMSDAGLRQILINKQRKFEMEDRIAEYESSDEFKKKKKKESKNEGLHYSN